MDEIGRDHPLLFLMPEHVLGPENTTIAIVAGTDEHRSAAIRRQEALSIAWFASLVADALDLALERYGRPSRAELASAFAGPLVDAKIADRIARAVELYLDGDTDAAGHMIAPRLERIVRGMARDSGLLVIREPVGARPGGVRSLNEVLADLQGRIPEGWRYFVSLLTDPLGHNLRNLVGHGLLDEVSRPHAAMLIHAAAVLGAMEPEAQR